MTRRLSVWLPAVLWALFLFMLSEMRSAPALVRPFLGFSDKLAHLTLYFVFGVLLGRIGATLGSRLGHSLLLLAGAAYAAADEWHQSFVPGRSPDPADWLADLAGLGMGYLTIMRVRARSTRGMEKTDRE